MMCNNVVRKSFSHHCHLAMIIIHRNAIRSILPSIFASIALILSIYAAYSCTFVQFVIPPSTHSHDQAGFWSYQWWDHDQQKYSCIAYPNENDNDNMSNIMVVDSKWKAARAFSSLILIFGGLPLMHIIFSAAVDLSCGNSNLLAGASYLICCICSSLSLLFVRSNACQHNTIFNLTRNKNCILSTGARSTYAAMALWFIAASLAILIDEDKEGGTQQHSHDDDVDDANNSIREPLIQVDFEYEQSDRSIRSDEIRGEG